MATRGKDDPKEMFDLIGDKAHRKLLENNLKIITQFSNSDSCRYVDYGFDVPSLTVMYNDKPLKSIL